MKKSPESVRLQKLLSRACDAPLNDASQTELEGLLTRHPELIDQYATFVATEALIEVACGKAVLDLEPGGLSKNAAVAPSRQPSPRPAPPRASSREPWVLTEPARLVA